MELPMPQWEQSLFPPGLYYGHIVKAFYGP